jgi:hypothetical protein
MARSLFLLALTAATLLAADARADAQAFVRRPNGNNVPNRSHYRPYDITRFSANPVYPTRFHAAPIYPNTVFWSNLYPNSSSIQNALDAFDGQNANAPSMSPGNLSGPSYYMGPAYYPSTDIRFGRGNFDAQVR